MYGTAYCECTPRWSWRVQRTATAPHAYTTHADAKCVRFGRAALTAPRRRAYPARHMNTPRFSVLFVKSETNTRLQVSVSDSPKEKQLATIPPLLTCNMTRRWRRPRCRTRSSPRPPRSATPGATCAGTAWAPSSASTRYKAVLICLQFRMWWRRFGGDFWLPSSAVRVAAPGFGGLLI